MLANDCILEAYEFSVSTILFNGILTLPYIMQLKFVDNQISHGVKYSHNIAKASLAEFKLYKD